MITTTMIMRTMNPKKMRMSKQHRGRRPKSPAPVQRRGCSRITPKRTNKRKGLLLALAIVLLIMGATTVLAPILVADMEVRQDTEAYEELRAQAQIAPMPLDTGEPHDWIRPSPDAITVGGTGVDLAACKAQNDDFIAWLQIPGTTIDYPVVLTNNTKYYLEHTFSGKKSYLGTLLSLGKTDYETPGKNIAIFGHHIRSNKQTMFSPLLSYKGQSFYTEHKTIYLDSLYHTGTYTVFAVINMRNGDWDPSMASFASDEAFLDFILRAKSLSLYETGITPAATDHVLTLITCDRSYIPTYGRLVVMAVKQEP